MIKIVYFDESSATDYLDIFNGGNTIQEKETITENKKELAEKLGFNIMAKFNWLILSGQAEAGVQSDFSQMKDTLLKTTISNTVLTDFLEKSQNDTRVEKLANYIVYPAKNSFAYFKMFTPYLMMTNATIPVSGGLNIDASKIDDALKNAKGYYEMVATNKDHTCILRFNISSFRNNYSIADLPKMNLKFYAIKVGTTTEELLDSSKEFTTEYNTQYQITSASQLRNGNTLNENANDLNVYDVVLAGVNHG